MRFNLTQASYRVLERASRLRLQRGVAAISSAKLLWALFEEDECRAACWLREAGLSLEQFHTAFGIQTLQSPISAPAFPVGSYGVSASPLPSTLSPTDLESTRTGNNSSPVGNPYPDPLPPNEPDHESEENSHEQPQDDYQPSEPKKYSLYASRQTAGKSAQSRLQFYLDDQRMLTWLLTPELEDNLEMVAHRFVRSGPRQSVTIAGGIRQVPLGVSELTLSTEHLFLAVTLDTGDVGRWIQENGFDPAELYQRIEETTDGRRQTTADGATAPLVGESLEPLASAAVCRLPSAVFTSSSALCRLLDAAANRGREAMRVIEDYVRFILDDADLTQRLKTFRHQFQHVLQQFPMQSRLEARNTEYDVGTAISAEGEYHRPTMADILSANFSRLQESLRSLEEFSKMSDPQIARQFEQLRYQGYTLHRDVALTMETKSENVSENVSVSENMSGTVSGHADLPCAPLVLQRSKKVENPP